MDRFAIGAFMEKGLTMGAGQAPVQKYWPTLLRMVEEGKLTPQVVVTHHLPLTDAPYSYRIFNDRADNCVKVVLKPGRQEA
jgi:threonine dehydrogenase-like Zn-dependent dehydrogenase